MWNNIVYKIVIWQNIVYTVIVAKILYIQLSFGIIWCAVVSWKTIVYTAVIWIISYMYVVAWNILYIQLLFQKYRIYSCWLSPAPQPRIYCVYGIIWSDVFVRTSKFRSKSLSFSAKLDAFFLFKSKKNSKFSRFARKIWRETNCIYNIFWTKKL